MSASQPPVIPPPPPAQPGRHTTGGLAIASAVLGGLSLPFALIVVGGFLALAGLLTGFRHVQSHKENTGLAYAGIGMSVLGAILSLTMFAVYSTVIRSVRDTMAEASQYEQQVFDGWIGVQAPAFEIQTVDGKSITPADLAGKRVIIDIWATWCPPCREEIPHFNDLAAAHPDDLVIIGISDEDRETLTGFMADTPITYVVATSEDFDLPAPYRNVTSLPTTFFIDRNGVVQDFRIGYTDYDELARLALSEDFTGDVRSEPVSSTAEPIVFIEAAWEPTLLHTFNASAAVSAIDAGQWDGVGAEEVALLHAKGAVTVVNSEGKEIATLNTSPYATSIGLGTGPGGAPRILTYAGWGRAVEVFNEDGEELWSFRSMMGIDGAHWGDIDGDGVDEMAVGCNGAGGLNVLSPEGKSLWDVGLGNVWTQSVVTRPDGGHVVATEAGGSVRVHDQSGKRIDVLRPQGRYLASIHADYSPARGKTIIIGVESPDAICFDETGAVLWVAPAEEYDDQWGTCSIASGDLNGDGEPEWVIRDPTGDLIIVNTAGEGLAVLSPSTEPVAFAILEEPGAPGRLAVATASTIELYGFDSGANPN